MNVLAVAVGGIQLETLLLLLGVIGFIFVVPRLLRRGRNAARERSESLAGRKRPRSLARESADAMMVELVDTGREISAQIDTKIRILNKLIRDADEATRRLEKAMAVVPPESVSLVAEDEVTAPAAAPRPETSASSRAPTPVLPATLSGEADREDVAEDMSLRTPSGRWKVDVRQQIACLSSEGREPAEIARMTRLSTSEVNLVLHLLQTERRR